MFIKAFSAKNPVLLVGGGPAGVEDLALSLSHAPRVVAVDGGARLALAAGLMPEQVIGDFDSLDAATRAQIPEDRLLHVAEQDTTDFEKALERISAPAILAVGFLGGRIDHQLAAFSALVRFAHQPCVLLGPDELMLHCPTALTLDMAEGDVVSLFPLLPVRGRSTGLDWPIDGLTLAPGGRIGTSNRATGGPVTLLPETPGLLVVLPRTSLPLVMQALQAPAPEPARWPAL